MQDLAALDMQDHEGRIRTLEAQIADLTNRQTVTARLLADLALALDGRHSTEGPSYGPDHNHTYKPDASIDGWITKALAE